jgi:uncharacterized protein
MIFRIILIAILAVILWYIIRMISHFSKIMTNVRHAADQHFNGFNRSQNIAHKPMVKCSLCNLYVEEKDAILAEGKPYCCKDHARSAGK